MFVTILFGDGKMEMFNLNCKLINFIHHLKERCSLDFRECVDLLDSSGKVMNLEEKQHSSSRASSVLVERQFYVLLRVCRDPGTGGQKYESLLNDFSQSHPELTELLRKLSNPAEEPERKRKGGRPRSKVIPANNKRATSFTACGDRGLLPVDTSHLNTRTKPLPVQTRPVQSMDFSPS